MTRHYDIIVVGGGLVGASLALALGRQGRRVALVEGQDARFDDLRTGWDPRVYAVSPANRAFLDSLSAWPDMERVGVIEAMRVRGDTHGLIEFDRHDAGSEALAWIAENRWMLAALWRRLGEEPGVERLTGARPAGLERSELKAALTLDDGSVLEAPLLVGADGANSWVRREIGVEASVKPYGQSGVVANFECEKHHGNIARQWFFGDSVLAWLPMAGNRISIVWSTFQPERLTELDDAELAHVVAGAGGGELGAFTTLTSAVAFPLRLIRPDATVSRRVALAGDAAHTVHPLAGQGVNLGFQDAATLAGLIGGAGDPGAWMLLRRYERDRREAVRTMQMACDGLFTLFHGRDVPGLAWLRNTGLSLTNRLAPVKRQFVRHAIGF
ncbi:UbiH/UbiF family hydroxylase [Paludibacterium paludis]|uniref:Ubiquinone biosynthesis hydroxylase n=1 Tax=Paludibacterium paludis TaxID=1225769 RepID=A0A918P053_9NEIS|nr:UbiH/UbiF family hydroxylase [Paludibacterium paludis]GGY11110.1 ubiquinone biosynthesis hydroxylase [Paludibacterium paludis]